MYESPFYALSWMWRSDQSGCSSIHLWQMAAEAQLKGPRWVVWGRGWVPSLTWTGTRPGPLLQTSCSVPRVSHSGPSWSSRFLVSWGLISLLGFTLCGLTAWQALWQPAIFAVKSSACNNLPFLWCLFIGNLLWYHCQMFLIPPVYILYIM